MNLNCHVTRSLKRTTRNWDSSLLRSARGQQDWLVIPCVFQCIIFWLNMKSDDVNEHEVLYWWLIRCVFCLSITNDLWDEISWESKGPLRLPWRYEILLVGLTISWCCVVNGRSPMLSKIGEAANFPGFFCVLVKNQNITGWCFQTFLEFSPPSLGRWSTLTSIFFTWVGSTTN